MDINDFNKYIVDGEAKEKEKAKNWKAAIGLQDVDRLKPSQYLLEIADSNIKGNITINETYDLIHDYYEEKNVRKEESNKNTEEADKVSCKIAGLLAENSFSLSVRTIQDIHRRLFEDIFLFAGTFRNVNLSKKELVLGGDSVHYESFSLIEAALLDEIAKEKKINFQNLSKQDLIDHFSSFISAIWQIHPFREGNTRVTAVFAIKYLKSIGFDVNNELFANNSLYFRNSLVRANYNNIPKGITATNEYLNMFFENLLFNAKYELKNRNLIVG